MFFNTEEAPKHLQVPALTPPLTPPVASVGLKLAPEIRLPGESEEFETSLQRQNAPILSAPWSRLTPAAGMSAVMATVPPLLITAVPKTSMLNWKLLEIL